MLCNIYIEMGLDQGSVILNPLATFARLPADSCHSFKMLMLVEKRSHCSGQKAGDALSARPLDGCRKPVAVWLVARRLGGVR